MKIQVFIPLYNSLFYWTPDHYYITSTYTGVTYVHYCLMLGNSGINFKVGDKQIQNYQETRGYVRLVKDVE